MMGVTDNQLMREAAERVYQQVALVRADALRGQDFKTLYVRSFFDLDPSAQVKLGEVSDGNDRGKLTLYEKTASGQWIQMPGIVPADCWNLIKPGEDLGTTVRRIMAEGDREH